jgi:NADH dehydrogenase [ubiquinone] 1 alpha subcomplex assembly factor 1
MYRYLSILVLTFSMLLPLRPSGATDTPSEPTCGQLLEESVMSTQSAVTNPILIDMALPELADLWEVVNDDVMGGVSDSTVSVSERGTAFFSGNVSLENNGGFASLQARFRPIDISDFDGLDLTICGDGNRYGFWLRERNQRVVHQFEFETEPGVWATVRVPFNELEPNFFGDWVNADPIDLTQVSAMSFIIDNGQAGAFALEIQRIALYQDEGE